jgi:hypothetical protein
MPMTSSRPVVAGAHLMPASRPPGWLATTGCRACRTSRRRAPLAAVNQGMP